MKKLLYSENTIDIGLLIVRIGIGITFIIHGYPKVFEGHAEGLAKGLTAAGIPGGVFAAYLAGFAEFLGGIALIIGLLFRPTALVLAVTMGIAVILHVNLGGGFTGANSYSHPLESAIVFVALMFTGPGKLSIDSKLFGK